MAGKLISFRLSEADVEALQAQGLPEESLNLTAQRVLREALGVSTVDKTVDRAVNSIDLDSRIGAIVESKTAFLVTGLNQKLKELEEKLEKL